MFSRVVWRNSPNISLVLKTLRTEKNFSTTSARRSMKVTVLGAGGRTGSSLSLFLKNSGVIDELAIYDRAEIARGLALELGHIDTKCKVTCCRENSDEGLGTTLEGSKIVAIAVGKCCVGKNFSYENFIHNANLLFDFVPKIIKHSPTALVALITSPINHLVPLIVEIYKKHGLADYNRIFGVTSINNMRANVLLAKILDIDPECVTVPTIGGNCSKTCVPLLSQTIPSCRLTHEETSKLRYGVRMAEEENTTDDFSGTSSPLSMGYAAARFCISLCKALRDERGIVEYAYARSCIIPEVTYFAGPLELGPCGIQKYLGVPSLKEEECKLLASAIPHLREAILSGETLVLNPREASTEVCPQSSELCEQKIDGKMRTSDSFSQLCPTSC